MAKMTKEHLAKVREASSGLKKLDDKQKEAIFKLWETNDSKMTEVEKLVHKSVLFAITGDRKYAPKQGRNERAEQLNEILFS